MKIHNPLVYTFGVMLLTMHLVEWFDVFMNGFTTSSVLALVASFIVGTYEITNSIEFDASRKEDDNK
jgi:hypothetical protein